MIEFRIHGRGGQGNVAAAYLLAAAAFEGGKACQAFPAFGAERRGAPVTAFVRVDDKPIQIRSQVRQPHYLIVQDETLLHDSGITHGLRPGGGMIVNSTLPADEVEARFGHRSACLPATDMAMDTIGRPIPNTALLAALFALTGIMPLDALSRAVEHRFHGDMLQNNLALVARAAKAVAAGAWGEADHAARA